MQSSGFDCLITCHHIKQTDQCLGMVYPLLMLIFAVSIRIVLYFLGKLRIKLKLFNYWLC